MFLAFWPPMGYFRGIQKCLFGSTCIGENVFFMFRSIQTFEFGVGVRLKHLLVYSSIAEQILFSMLP